MEMGEPSRRVFPGRGLHSGGFLHPPASQLSPRSGEMEGSSALGVLLPLVTEGCHGERGY